MFNSFIFSITSFGSSLFLAHFLVHGFLSWKPIGLPRFMRSRDSLDCSIGISISIGAFAAGIYDLVTLFGLVNAFGD